MPIKSKTNQTRRVVLGTIRKGAPKPQDQKRPGADLDCFRFAPATTDDESANLMISVFKSLYGDKPNKIQFFLTEPEVDANFQAYLDVYDFSGLKARSDGEFVILRRNEAGQLVETHELLTDDMRKNEKFKAHGILWVMLPEFMTAIRQIGWIKVVTTSYNDVQHIDAVLRFVYQLTTRPTPDENGEIQMLGDLRRVPFILSRESHPIKYTAEDGKKKEISKSLLRLSIAPEWLDQKFALASGQSQTLQLPEPTLETEMEPVEHLEVIHFPFSYAEKRQGEKGEYFVIMDDNDKEVAYCTVIPPNVTVAEAIGRSGESLWTSPDNWALSARWNVSQEIYVVFNWERDA